MGLTVLKNDGYYHPRPHRLTMQSHMEKNIDHEIDNWSACIASFVWKDL